MELPIYIQLLVAGLSIGSIYALVALGLALAFKGTGIINFAHGELFAFGAYTALFLHSGFHLPYWQVLVLAVLITGVFGIILERTLIRPLMQAPPFTVVIATLAMGLIIKNSLRLSWQESVATIPSPLSGVRIQLSGVSINPQYLWVTGCSLAIMGLLALFFRKSLIGKAMQAVSQNQEAARLMGIRVNIVFPLTFAFSAAIAGLAGILIAPLTGIQAEMGLIILKGFVAAILGGFTSLIGCVVGGLILGILETFGGAYFGGLFKEGVAFILLIVVLLLRPNGIFGRAEARRV